MIMNDSATILELLKVDPPRAWRHLVDEYSSLILAVIARYNPDPDDREIREWLEGNLCRCTGYQNIVRAVKAGADAMRAGK